MLDGQAPWRRTRFERLASDYKQIAHSCEVISMHLEDVTSKAIHKQVGTIASHHLVSLCNIRSRVKADFYTPTLNIKLS